MPKRAIRSRLLEQRQELVPDLRRRYSEIAQTSLIAAPEFSAARSIGLYSPVHNEVETGLLRTVAEAAGMLLAYPRVLGRYLEFVALQPGEDLVKGSFGVLEPQGEVLVDPGELDLLVLPGVAFDQRGHRLGYGKGFYDRALEGHEGNVATVGLAFAFQQVELLPNQVHDVQLQMLATENGLVRFAGNSEERG